MAPSAPYQPQTPDEVEELSEYLGRWKKRGLTFTHFVHDHDERALWIRKALSRNKPISPKDFGKRVWFEDGVCY